MSNSPLDLLNYGIVAFYIQSLNRNSIIGIGKNWIPGYVFKTIVEAKIIIPNFI